MHLTAIDDAAWESPWRRRRCADKVALSLSLVLTALLLPPWPASVLVAVTSIVLIVAVAKIPARTLATVMAAPAVFIVLGAATIAVSVGASTTGAWWHWGALAVTHASTMQAASALGHGIAGTLAVMVLATTTPMVDILTWLRTLHVPDPLLEIASLTYRLLFVLLSTALTVREAQVNRLGHDAGLRRSFRATADATGHVLVRSWDRAQRLEAGLELRGYDGSLTTVAKPQLRSPALLVCAVALPAAVVAATLLAGALT